MDQPVTHPGPRPLITTSDQVRESSGVTVENMPAGEDVGAGSVSAFIEVLTESAIAAQLPPCPDWPDLN